MQVQDLIHSSMRLVAGLGHGQSGSTPELADCLTALNLMIDSWNAQDLMLYTTGRAVYSLTSGKQTYTLGPSGADWVATRPQNLDSAGLILNNVTPAYERPLRILSELEWAHRHIKTLSSPLPLEIYFENDYPNAQVSLWPVPQINYQVALYTEQALAAFVNLTDTVSLPPGYAEAIRYNLAVRLAAEFGGEAPASVVALAEQLQSTIKRQNFTIEPSRVDREIQGPGRWSIWTGELGGGW
jgi:hypothetical protein